jgi:PKD repeat protein
VLSYSWSFGDSNTATGSTVSHTYATAGTYTATLTVEDGNGGSDTASVVISVDASSPPGPGQKWVVLEAKSCNGPCDFDQIKADLEAQGLDLGFVKIGFHVAPTGNQTGLGNWEQTLHNAGVPFFLKSVDSAGQIFEAVQLKAASGCIDNSRDGGSPTCVPHQLVYRKSVDGDSSWVPDVPYTGSPDCSNPPPADTPHEEIYDQTPYEAALTHWQRHRDAFPPELEPYKHLIWIETINEINRGGTCDFDGDGVGGEVFPHNQGLVDPVFGQYTKEGEWIAEFAIHTANFAIGEGFNWAAFGWSSGEPEIGTWAGPKMREFLELVAANPDRLAIATHEYSYTIDGLEQSSPGLLGRFQEVFDVADYYGISRPPIVITEFGWTLNDTPGVNQAMNVDLPWAAELYAPHHEIQGAAIWYLGGGWGGIDNEVQQLIAPVTDYATHNYFVLGPAGVSVGVSTNQAGYSTGDTLAVSLQADKPGYPGTADFYFGVILPDGDTVVVFTNQQLETKTVSVSDLANWSPMAAGVDWAAPFTANEPDSLTYTWLGNEVPGSYTFFLPAVVPGGFSDGTVDEGDIIHSSTATFTFAP